MNDALKMQISAFIDGELPENESELLLRRLSQDPAMRQQVAEYIEIGRLIRREREVPGTRSLRGRIAAELGDGEQPVESAPVASYSRRRYLKPAAGVAVAATVAAVALIGLRQAEVPVAEERSVAAVESTGLAAPNDRSAGNNRSYTEPAPVLTEAPGEMLTQYYLSHGATSADLGANGILTRLVTLELREGELVEVEPAQGGDAESYERGRAGTDPAEEETRPEAQ